MDALHLLTIRRSSKNLTASAPSAEQIEQMLQAATQVPDHGNMRPFRFTVVESEDGLSYFRKLLTQAVTECNLGKDSMKKAERIDNMAPLVTSVTPSPNCSSPKPKPEWEQVLSAGCSAYALQLAASTQGFGDVRITGLWVNGPQLREAFDYNDREKIIGLIMIGTSAEETAGPKDTDLDEFATHQQRKLLRFPIFFRRPSLLS